MPAYLIYGRRLCESHDAWQETLAEAHARRTRPRCLCTAAALEMYVARVDRSFLVKRMPRTGWLHAATCPSFEPAPELSGLGPNAHTAVSEDPDTGLTSVKLDFAMSEGASRDVARGPPSQPDAAEAESGRMSLRSLLLYLWERSGVTRWHPGFLNRRSWGTVRGLVLSAAQSTVTSGRRLSDRLFVPEVFSADRKTEMAARRQCAWARMARAARTPKPWLLLVAELKELAPSRHGAHAIFKHLPDVPFVLDSQLFGRIERRFGPELDIWAAADDLHLVAIATFAPSRTGVPRLQQVALLVTSSEWLPVDSLVEVSLVRQLVRERRAFVKSLGYQAFNSAPVAAATLTDAGPSPVAVFIADSEEEERRELAIQLAAAFGTRGCWWPRDALPCAAAT
jgi:hypothetical protein